MCIRDRFITHDFDEALKLADRIAIMKDGIIEQLDTHTKIVLNPATEYVRKFTEEVPREKVLLIEDVMEQSTGDNLGDLRVSKHEIIENVAEKILTQDKTVGVIDKNNKVNRENRCLSFFFKIADLKAITKSSLPIAIIFNIQIAW